MLQRKNMKTKYKRILCKLRRPIYNFFKLGTSIFGLKDPKYEKLIESTLYELRLMFIFNIAIIGLYIFLSTIENSSDPEMVKWVIKISGLLLVLIIFLTIRIIVKTKFKYYYHENLNEELKQKLFRYNGYFNCETEKNRGNEFLNQDIKDHQLKIDFPNHDSNSLKK